MRDQEKAIKLLAIFGTAGVLFIGGAIILMTYASAMDCGKCDNCEPCVCPVNNSTYHCKICCSSDCPCNMVGKKMANATGVFCIVVACVCAIVVLFQLCAIDG